MGSQRGKSQPASPFPVWNWFCAFFLWASFPLSSQQDALSIFRTVFQKEFRRKKDQTKPKPDVLSTRKELMNTKCHCSVLLSLVVYYPHYHFATLIRNQELTFCSLSFTYPQSYYFMPVFKRASLYWSVSLPWQMKWKLTQWHFEYCIKMRWHLLGSKNNSAVILLPTRTTPPPHVLYFLGSCSILYLSWGVVTFWVFN